MSEEGEGVRGELREGGVGGGALTTLLWRSSCVCCVCVCVFVYIFYFILKILSA